MPSLTIRPARASDAAPLTDLYNHYVRETPISFDVAPWTVEARAAWISEFAATGRYRLLVAEESARVVGYACTRRFREKAAYETTVETSIYLAAGTTGRGLGHALYSALFEAIRGEDLRRAIAGVTLPNDASVKLHERFGFCRTGVTTEVGRKFGRYWDVAWYERALPCAGASALNSSARG
jgi:phosphinothricin acetyltransferase